jgi:hypothetical protein
MHHLMYKVYYYPQPSKNLYIPVSRYSNIIEDISIARGEKSTFNKLTHS